MNRNLSRPLDGNNVEEARGRIRRCAIVFIELRERPTVDLNALLAGGTGIAHTRQMILLAPHLDREVEIDPDELALLAGLDATKWVEQGSYEAAPELVDRLIALGVIVVESDPASCLRDTHVREGRWFPPAALLHSRSRWQAVDSVASMENDGLDRADTLRIKLGPPPEQPVAATERVSLPEPTRDSFDDLLQRRATCRNFDASRALDLAMASQLLYRVFGEQGSVRVADDTTFAKKNVPSGGSLHPTEAMVVVQNVAGLSKGVYRYDGGRHALIPVQMPTSGTLEAFILNAVAGQHWFADAHVMVILAPRFERTFWKYRNHAKAYRVVAMEAGHIAQTVYLAATDAGLGAFVTAAINEIDIDRTLGFDGITQGSMAICGFGWRASTMQIAEFDPAGAVWPQPLTT